MKKKLRNLLISTAFIMLSSVSFEIISSAQAHDDITYRTDSEGREYTITETYYDSSDLTGSVKPTAKIVVEGKSKTDLPQPTEIDCFWSYDNYDCQVIFKNIDFSNLDCDSSGYSFDVYDDTSDNKVEYGITSIKFQNCVFNPDVSKCKYTSKLFGSIPKLRKLQTLDMSGLTLNMKKEDWYQSAGTDYESNWDSDDIPQFESKVLAKIKLPDEGYFGFMLKNNNYFYYVNPDDDNRVIYSNVLHKDSDLETVVIKNRPVAVNYSAKVQSNPRKCNAINYSTLTADKGIWSNRDYNFKDVCCFDGDTIKTPTFQSKFFTFENYSTSTGNILKPVYTYYEQNSDLTVNLASQENLMFGGHATNYGDEPDYSDENAYCISWKTPIYEWGGYEFESEVGATYNVTLNVKSIDVPILVENKTKVEVEHNLPATMQIVDNDVKLNTLSNEYYDDMHYEFVGKKIVYFGADQLKSYNGKDPVSVQIVGTPKEWSIDYDLNGGTLQNKNPEKYNISSGANLNEPTKKGYTFDGWYIKDENNKVSNLSELITLKEDVCLVARWKEIKQPDDTKETPKDDTVDTIKDTNVPSNSNKFDTTEKSTEAVTETNTNTAMSSISRSVVNGIKPKITLKGKKRCIALTVKNKVGSSVQMQLCKSKKFKKGVKTFSTKKAKSTFKKIKKGKYFVRVRFIDKDKSTSKWSSVKKVKVK